MKNTYMCIFFTHAQLSFFLYTTITYVVTEKEVVCQEKMRFNWQKRGGQLSRARWLAEVANGIYSWYIYTIPENVYRYLKNKAL